VEGGLKGEGGTVRTLEEEDDDPEVVVGDEAEGTAPEENGEAGVVGVRGTVASDSSWCGLTGELTVMVGTTGRSVPVMMADKSVELVVARASDVPFTGTAAKSDVRRRLRLIKVAEGDGGEPLSSSTSIAISLRSALSSVGVVSSISLDPISRDAAC
jgi:hypothetical protein